jgi:S1-C subfamily serine protease
VRFTRHLRPVTRGRLGVAVAVVAIVVTGAILLGTRDSAPRLDEAGAETIASDVVDQAIDDLERQPANSAVVYQKILPSLVVIESKRRAAKKNNNARLGTGVIVNRQGAILTAYHVVAGAATIRVTFVDGTRSTAIVAEADPEHDTAVLAPKRLPQVLVPAVLGGRVQLGDDAYAVGNPLGFVDSITSGVISGLERSVDVPDGKRLRGLIQFDAAVNPGNSGGPLLNRGGQVVGIVTAIANPGRDGYFIGIGFAVPIGTAGGAANAPSK